MMKKPTLTALAIVAIVAVADAQWRGRYYYRGNRAATVGESHARGMSELVRARGQLELDSSAARINRAEARSRELDNRLKATNTYFEMRNINREQRFGTEQERYERRSRNNEQRFAAAAARGNPNELTYRQLDPATGKITWPFSLMDPKFEEYRERLDDLFARRATYNGQVTFEMYSEIRQTTDEFLETLRGEIRNMETRPYMEARRFVNALAYQVEQA
jgi:hypothetical protein